MEKNVVWFHRMHPYCITEYLNEELKHCPSLGAAITMLTGRLKMKKLANRLLQPYHPGLSSIKTYVRPDYNITASSLASPVKVSTYDNKAE